MPARKAAPAHSKVAMKAVPTRRTLVLLETGLILGLVEGILTDTIAHLSVSPYIKALFLMVGVIGAFAFALRIFEPVIRFSLKTISKADAGHGAMMRVGLHALILFAIYVAYIRTFFPTFR